MSGRLNGRLNGRRVATRAFGAPAAILLLLLTAAPGLAASVPAASGTGGAVAAGDAHGTATGLEVLAAGGNAVDAAVATALALAVTFPEAGNLGGGGFAVVRLPAADGTLEVATLDFRERAPAAAHRDLYLGDDGEPVRERSLVGPLAAGVPGSPAGLYELHRRFGELPWERVVAPAVELANDGFVVNRHLHRVLGAKREILARFPETAAIWLPDGAPPAVGSRIALPELARTLAAYAERGPEAILRGPVAARIEAVAHAHGGVLTAADLAAYEPTWRPPVRFSAFGWSFAGMDLPSSGGILTGQVLGMLERSGWAAAPRFGAERAHLLTEALRRAYADRFLLGDPATTEPAAADLLADAWLDRRAASIDPRRATASTRVGDWSQRAVVAGEAEAAASGETTQISVADGRGGFVALTTTVNDLFGCGLWVPGFGFLNDEMDDFAAAPGRPNLYGLVQGEANAVAPGKRMLSSMSPTLAWKEGAWKEGTWKQGTGSAGGEVVALGGRGGSRIPSATIQVLLALIVDGDPLQTALGRPRLHHQWLPDELRSEPDALAPETRAALSALGHTLEPARGSAKIQAVRRRTDGTLEAASDPRGPGAAAVVDPLTPICCFLPPAPPAHPID